MTKSSKQESRNSEEFWTTDTPTTVGEALKLLAFGGVLNPIGQERVFDMARTERRMLACARFFEKAVSERGSIIEECAMVASSHGNEAIASDILQLKLTRPAERSDSTKGDKCGS